MPPTRPTRTLASPIVFLAFLALGLTAAGPVRSAPPDEGECPTVSGVDEEGNPSEDAAPILIKEGMIIDEQSLLALRVLLQKEIWRNREAIFYEGMRMVIGPCHRRYALPAFYEAATARFAGQATLDRKGNLERYTAGLPFPPELLDPDASDAGLRWAWNVEKRFRGTGHEGRFRINNHPSRLGSVQRYEGKLFFLPVAERSDLAGSGYAIEDPGKMIWAAGGEFTSPFSARGLAWRQFRVRKSARRWNQPDNIFVYVPTMRKMRRAATRWVDGGYVPAYTVSGQSGGGAVAYGEAGAISPDAGRNISATEHARSGLTGLFLRPNAYVWRLRGEQAVIAPIDSVNPGWPVNADRNYGYSGLSPASDRWDVRQAVVIEGALKERNETIRTVTIFVDYQTQQPLYWIARGFKRRPLDVGILVHDYTGDHENAPKLADGSPVRVFLPAGAFFFNALAGRGGWVRESWSLDPKPLSRSDEQRMTTSDRLQRGH